jgi:inner membrane protein
MYTDRTTEHAAPRRLRYPATVELAILGGLAIVLMIALSMIRSLVSERADRAASVRAEIASSWGQSQTIGGPVIIVPYRVHVTDDKGRSLVTTSHARFLPERLDVKGTLLPKLRHRGIFETVLYRADLRIEGDFPRPDFRGWGIDPEDVLWDQAVITIGISDLRGMRGNPVLRWAGSEVGFSGGSADAHLWPTGLTAAIAFPAANGSAERYPFSIDLHVSGSEAIAFLPLGGESVAELSSSWSAPSFGGAFLPESSKVTPAGFSARWAISSLARSYPQRWRDSGDENASALAALAPSAFRVGLFAPVGGYQLTERSMKYGALFIILTFTTFFLYELLSPVTLHPVQYLLVGGALCLFYLLLLSISEQAPFGLAYGIASGATVGLISSYAAAILRNRLRVLGLTSVLGVLYSYLYVLLQLEDWALLMGSIGLFVILALIMYTTRRVDWAAAHLGGMRTE